MQSRIDHFNDYVSLVDLEEEEAYLRYRLIEHCLFRVKQDIFHALCMYTGAKHNTKSMKHHLRYLKRLGFVHFQGSLMKVKCCSLPYLNPALSPPLQDTNPLDTIFIPMRLFSLFPLAEAARTQITYQ